MLSELWISWTSGDVRLLRLKYKISENDSRPNCEAAKMHRVNDAQSSPSFLPSRLAERTEDHAAISAHVDDRRPSLVTTVSSNFYAHVTATFDLRLYSYTGSYSSARPHLGWSLY